MVNIASEAGNFFQTTAELQKQKEKEAKYNYTEGDAIQLPTKALDMIVLRNGQYAYVAESGFHAKRINLKTNKAVKLFKGHNGPVTSLALSADGTILWTGSWDKTIKKWDTVTGECLATLVGHTDFVKSLVLVGKWLYSGSSDMQIRQWDTETLACTAVLKNHSRGIESLAVDQSGKYLYAASSDRCVTRWDISTGKCIAKYEDHDTSVYCVRVYDDEMWTASADKTVRRWNVETGTVDTVLTHPDRVKSVLVVGPYVVTGASDDNIRVWDVASGKLISTIRGHFDEIGCLDAVGTTLFSASLDCSLRRWSLTPSALEEYNKKPLKVAVPEESEKTGLTEEEERELAELMASDDDE
ncbi:WD40-repeat-containing domain protein [Dichotomocladium elegans]|nr:WD40-repeat-containing domain protein [Dichotomocladium elegans]